jgi:hypothetical protein
MSYCARHSVKITSWGCQNPWERCWDSDREHLLQANFECGLDN